MNMKEKGNSGCIGFFIRVPEITPNISASETFTENIYLFDGDDNRIYGVEPEVQIRALVEGQFISMRLHSEKMGILPSRIIVTGGASANRSIVQVIADVFGVHVFSLDQTDSASLGAAFRAFHAYSNTKQNETKMEFSDLISGSEGKGVIYKSVASPDLSAHAEYSQMLPRYAKLERVVIEEA
eukprot:GSMAST32.ASY1.ANO1.1451.1 assembled CDS